MATFLKKISSKYLKQSNGLVHSGNNQRGDDRDTGLVGEYFDTTTNKTIYTGLVRSRDPLNKRFVLFDGLEQDPFVTEQIDFTNVPLGSLDLANLTVTNSTTLNKTIFKYFVPVLLLWHVIRM